MTTHHEGNGDLDPAQWRGISDTVLHHLSDGPEPDAVPESTSKREVLSNRAMLSIGSISAAFMLGVVVVLSHTTRVSEKKGAAIPVAPRQKPVVASPKPTHDSPSPLAQDKVDLHGTERERLRVQFAEAMKRAEDNAETIRRLGPQMFPFHEMPTQNTRKLQRSMLNTYNGARDAYAMALAEVREIYRKLTGGELPEYMVPSIHFVSALEPEDPKQQLDDALEEMNTLAPAIRRDTEALRKEKPDANLSFRNFYNKFTKRFWEARDRAADAYRKLHGEALPLNLVPDLGPPLEDHSVPTYPFERPKLKDPR